MIRITKKDVLDPALAFCRVRENPNAPPEKLKLSKTRSSPLTRNLGRSTWPHYLHLAYAEGFLTFSTTDLEHTIISRFPVEGAAAPWSGVIETWRFIHDVRHLTHGVVDLGPVDNRVLHLRREERETIREGDVERERVRLFQCPLWLFQLSTPFPVTLNTEPPVAVAEVTSQALLNALRFLAGGKEREDLESKRQLCTLFADGAAMGACESVDWTATGPPLGTLNLAMRKHTVKRMVAWLEAVTEHNENSTTSIQISRHRDDRGRILYRLSTSDHHHQLIVQGVDRHYVRARIDQVRQVPPALLLRINRKALWTASRLLGANSLHHRIVCRLQSAASGGMELYVQEKRDIAPGEDAILGTVLYQTDDPMSVVPFELSARALCIALDQFATDEVVLAFRPAAPRLSVQAPPTASSAGSLPVPASEAFIRVMRHRGFPEATAESEVSESDALQRGAEG